MPKSKIFDIILVASAVILLGLAGYLWFNFNHLYQEAASKLNQQKAELKSAIEKFRTISELRQKRNEFILEGKRLDAFIPNLEGQAEFVMELERLATASKVEIGACKLDQKPKFFI